MKQPVYIRCPRCELNYIQKKDKFCNVCKLEMKALGSLDIEDNLDLELCPVCKVNYINPDEDMCVACAKERALEEGLNNDNEDDNSWSDYSNDDGAYSEDEERGEMVSITDLDDDDVLDDDDDLALAGDDDDDSDGKLEEDEMDDDDDFDDAFDDLDDDDTADDDDED